MRFAAALVAVAGLLGSLGHGALPSPRSPLPPGWFRIDLGPDGGAVYQGIVRNPALPASNHQSLVYLPPHVVAGRRYPLLVLLHGMPGSPYSISQGLQWATFADRAIESGAAPPFVALVPAVGLPVRFDGEWAGEPERFVVGTALPWAKRMLPVSHGPAAIAGLSAGGFGAVDIGLRHPGLFDTLESWSGYFHPLYDGAFRHATAAFLAAHDPRRLVRAEAPLLRRLGTRFFLSSGTVHDKAGAKAARAFAAELGRLGLPVRLWLEPGGHDGALWRAQLPAAIAAAFPAAAAA
jgi:enterochelin esterase-like enzyme